MSYLKFNFGALSQESVPIQRAFKLIQDCFDGGIHYPSGLYADHIYEITSAHGVDIDSVLLKDGLVDGVDVAAHAAGTAYSQHTAGVGTHTHQSSGAEGGTLDHGLALTGLTDDDHTQYLHLNKASQTILQNILVDAGVTIDGVDISALSSSFLAHHTRHENGGADEISLTGLEGASISLTTLYVDHIAEKTVAHNIVTDNVLQLGANLDANSQLIINPQGIGASDGLDFVYAEQYAGADIGAKVNAAFAAGARKVKITVSASLTTTITVPAWSILEFARNANLTCSDDIAAISVGQNAQVINPMLTGAGDPLKTSNIGIVLTSTDAVISGASIDSFYIGVLGGSSCYLLDCYISTSGYAGVYCTGSSNRYKKVYVTGSGAGDFGFVFSTNGAHNLVSCEAWACGKNGYKISNSNENNLISCRAINNSVDVANTYDGILVEGTSVNNSFISCASYGTGRHRYGIAFTAVGHNEVIGGVYNPNDTDDWLKGTLTKVIATYNTDDFLIDNPLQMGGTVNMDANLITNPKGIGGSTGKRIVFADTAADIITAITDTTVGEIIIGAGTYTFSAETLLSSNQHIIGRGVVNFDWSGAAGGYMFRNAAATNVVFENITWAKTGNNYYACDARAGFHFKKCTIPNTGYRLAVNGTNVLFSDRCSIVGGVSVLSAYCTFRDCDLLTNSIDVYNATYVKFSNCNLSTYIQVVQEVGYTVNKSLLIEGCHWIGGGACVYFYSAAVGAVTIANIRLIGNTFQPTNNTQHCVQVVNNANLTINDLLVEGNYFTTAASAYLIPNGTQNRWVLSNNKYETITTVYNFTGGTQTDFHYCDDSEWYSFNNRTLIPARNGILSASDITSIQGLKAYLAGAEQTIMVKSLLAALDADIIPSADVTQDLGSSTYKWLEIWGSRFRGGMPIWDWTGCETIDFHLDTNWWVANHSGTGAQYLGYRKLVTSTGATAGSRGLVSCPVGVGIPCFNYDGSAFLEIALFSDSAFPVGVKDAVYIPLRVTSSAGGVPNSQDPNTNKYIQFEIKYDAGSSQWKFYGRHCNAGGGGTSQLIGPSTTNFALNTHFRLRAFHRMNAAADEISYYVDDELIGTSTTNVPSGLAATVQYYQNAIWNGSDATSINLLTEYIRFYWELQK